MSTETDPGTPSTDQQSLGLPTQKRPSLVAWALAAGIVVLGLYVAVMRDYFGAYHPYSDDAGVILNSAAPWFSAARWTEWFTKGWAAYAVNYPDWGPFGNNTLKPVVNLVFCIEALLVPRIGNSAFLIMSYVAPAVTVFALVFAFHRLGKSGPVLSFVLALCVGFSAFWIGSLINAVDMTNTLALMFSAIVLALIPAYGERASLPLQVGLVLLQLAAIFSHETALSLSAVCVALMFALCDARPRLRDLWPFFAAPAIWLLVRLFVLQAHSGVYALSGAGLGQVKVWGFWLLSVLAPIDIQGLWMGRGLLPMSNPALRIPVLAAVVTVVAVNFLFVCAVLVAIVRRRDRRSLLLGLAFILASAPHLTTAFDLYGARFAGLSMTVGILVCLLLFPDHKRVLTVIACVLLAAEVLYCVTGLVERKVTAAEQAIAARQYSAYVHEAVNREKPRRVIAVNDRFGQYGVPSMIRLNAWPYEDFDVVVIDNLALGANPAGAVSIRKSGVGISIETTVSGDSAMSFLGADQVDFAKPNQGFSYALTKGTVAAPRAITATGSLDGKKTLVLGYDPANGSLFPPVTLP